MWPLPKGHPAEPNTGAAGHGIMMMMKIFQHAIL